MRLRGAQFFRDTQDAELPGWKHVKREKTLSLSTLSPRRRRKLLFGFIIALSVGCILVKASKRVSGVSLGFARDEAADDDNDDVFPVEASHARLHVKRAFLHAWRGYRRFAWGHDALRPVSQNYSDSFGGLGVTIVDAMDTALIMGLREEYEQGRAWVETSLDFDRTKEEVSFFETTIRVLGGLLSSYYLTGDSLFLRKAIDLGDRLIGSFGSPLELPYPLLNLTTGVPNELHNVTFFAEVGSCQLEFAALSRLSGNPIYKNLAEGAISTVRNEFETFDGLRPMTVSVLEVKQDGVYSMGAGIDSFYEYMLKRYIQLGAWGEDFSLQQAYGQDYVAMLAGMEKYLVVYGKKLVHLINLGFHKTEVSHKMHHLSCFTPGMLALGSLHIGSKDLRKRSLGLAERLCETCYQMYRAVNQTGLGPELVGFPVNRNDDVELGEDNRNVLRPETIESICILHRITGKEKYRRWGWNIFLAWERYSRIPEGGYGGLMNVTEPESHDDLQESFFLAESLKYLYLLYDDNNKVDFSKWVFNTEAHPLSLDPQWTPEKGKANLKEMLGDSTVA